MSINIYENNCPHIRTNHIHLPYIYIYTPRITYIYTHPILCLEKQYWIFKSKKKTKLIREDTIKNTYEKV